jgi:hypothetical protein
MTDQPLRDREDAEAESTDDVLEPQTHMRPEADGADEGEQGEDDPGD